MEKTGWKVLAIIFIIISLIQIICVVGFFKWAINEGSEIIEKENECIYNVCADDTSYIYYELEEICECYTDNELTKQEYMK